MWYSDYMSKVHRFFTKQNLALGTNTIVDTVAIDHIHVVRIKIHERVILFNGDGFEYDGTMTLIGDIPIIEILEKRRNKNEAPHTVHLFLGMLKREHTEYALEKATELGITDFTPLITERTVKTGIRLDRLDKIARNAAEQSGRAYIPTIHDIMSLKDAFACISKDTEILFCDTITEEKDVVKKPGNKAIFVGPEGGWTDEERALAEKHGATFVHLAPTILRGETAAIIGTYYAVNN